MQLVRATLQKLADNMQVGASVIVFVSTTLGGSTLGATVIFPDSTSIEIKLNFINHLIDGLQLEVAKSLVRTVVSVIDVFILTAVTNF